MNLIKRIFTKDTPQNKSSEIPTPEKTPYEIMGGKSGAYNLAKRFYDIMEKDSYAKPLLDLHPQPLDRIRCVFFEFLSGWLGGPDLFTEKYGHPMLRKRHLPFLIDEELRNQWIYCMNKALDIEIDNPLLRQGLKQSFSQLATHMINQE
ncbi:group II truncated hemoglobin [Pseudoalteromonas denitrificans]|uniref:Hemoglobin n=1 Tax=Pseudoalteromonas denitrificans DSM 6059 TaxID=1123010 RepID=A0A1I1JP66_9GAMM|nr:group II truncated hemoglobin [Pseudoalteromonas denitrificans]SFC50437.1 hemoglobin [Pseudoalteromonas denitrificans DSM 6059]